MNLKNDSICKAVFDASVEGIFVHDAKTGDILTVNKGAEILFGCSKEEIIKGSINRFSLGESPYSQKEAMLHIRKAREEGPQRFEWLSRRADGGLFWSEVSLSYTKLDGISVIIAIVRDISRQKDLEKRLSLSEARYRTLFEFMGDGVAVYEAIDDGEDFVFLDFNRAAERIENISRAEVIGRRITEVFPGIEEFGFLDVLREVHKTGIAIHYPVKYYRDERIQGWRENYVYRLPTGEIVAVYQDKTQELETEEVLMQKTDFLDKLINSMPAGVIIVNENRMFKWVSAKFEAITGYSAFEVLGSNTRFLYFDDGEYERVGKAYPLLDHGKEVDIETIWRRKDGKPINILLRGARLQKQTDRGQVVATVLDITNLKIMEEERLQMERRLRDVQRLESLGLIAGGIAHDFNNILMGIIGNAELALLRSKDGIQDNYIDAIISSSKKAAGLCKQLLAYAGKGKFETKILDVNALIEEIKQFLKLSISKDIDLEYQLQPDLPPIFIDPGLVEQIIMNLVLNASEAIEQKYNNSLKEIVRSKKIIVRTELVEFNSFCQKKCDYGENLTEGKYIKIEVEDNGCGMDEETRQRVFDPFFTTKFYGRGLGMATVMGIVRRHRGGINIESHKGKGTKVCVCLPASTGSPEIKAYSEQEVSGTLPRKPVLLVDDEPQIVKIGIEILNALGVQAKACYSGHECIEILRKDPTGFSCVICDFTMPGLTLKETLREIKKINRDLPIILSSGFSRQHVEEELKGFDMADFLQKPYSMNELRKVLQKYSK
ncbi:sensory box histidine kinase/response regulator [Dissulfuribacter thermophilus]|uniref:histidine kinase n=1 Tax=Dissulfuribacter thermophilus TaxID=1156395 RepID=A0A1B9F7S0_9BACT|nr:PAS domain-containing sensor histidine kinase [Dissulfuribacter thermophilus]OCC15855.1 sensory box histidine kinase/response regulator [Dissulfuribacter thermophilus]